MTHRLPRQAVGKGKSGREFLPFSRFFFAPAQRWLLHLTESVVTATRRRRPWPRSSRPGGMDRGRAGGRQAQPSPALSPTHLPGGAVASRRRRGRPQHLPQPLDEFEVVPQHLAVLVVFRAAEFVVGAVPALVDEGLQFGRLTNQFYVRRTAQDAACASPQPPEFRGTCDSSLDAAVPVRLG